MINPRWFAKEVFVTDPIEVAFFKENYKKYYAFVIGDSVFVPVLSYQHGLKEMNGE